MGRKFAAGRFCAVVVALGVVFAGCTGPAHPGGGGSSATAIWPTHESSPAQSASPTLTDEQLYQLAVRQYRSLAAILDKVERLGGAPRLPDGVGQYMIDPAWSAVNDAYSTMFVRGDHFVGEPDFQLLAVSQWPAEQGPDDAIVAVQACELSQGAAFVSASGEILQDGSPVIMHRWAYFKFDPADNLLKVFVLNGEAVDTCPIN